MNTRALPFLLVGLAAACVDAPTGATTESLASADPLALTFDQLSAQARTSGDVARGEAFAFAAMAARSGVTPSLLNVRNGTTSEVYEAFVNTVDWSPSVPIRIPAHRTLTAWRRGTDGVTRILSLTTPADSAPVLSPLALSPSGPVAAPFAGASALYQETTRITSLGSNVANAPVADEFWMASSGYVRIRESASGQVCPVEPAKAGLKGVTCRQARFTVRFDVVMQRLASRPYSFAAGTVTRRFTWTADQVIAGFKLGLTCASPTAASGCG
jgi:hypothetical protein